MKKLNFFLFSALLFLTISCKKENSQTSGEKEYIQHFNATIADKQITITNTYSTNKEALSGQRSSFLGNSGPSVDFYTVTVRLPKENSNDQFQSKLRFQIYGIKDHNVYEIDGSDPYYKDFNTHIVLWKRIGTGENDYKTYTPNPKYSPFKIQINKYQFPQGSAIPIVSGKLNGILYNIDNPQDYIEIKDGDFEVRH